MTDISKLADDLIALINSKPRSPTRDEVLSVLMPAVIQPTMDRIRRDIEAITEQPLEPKGAPVDRKPCVNCSEPYGHKWDCPTIRQAVTNPAFRDLPLACIPGHLHFCNTEVFGDPARPQDYVISQATLDNALSCENGHDWEGDSHVCHRCGAQAILGAGKPRTWTKATLAKYPHVESEEF